MAFQKIYHLVWLDKSVISNWQEENNAYLSGYSVFGSGAVFKTLGEAQRQCLRVSLSDCGGVT